MGALVLLSIFDSIFESINSRIQRVKVRNLRRQKLSRNYSKVTFANFVKFCEIS